MIGTAPSPHRRAWTPVGAWAFLVLLALTRTGADLRSLKPLAGPASAALAHLVLFGVLGYLVARALRLEGWLRRGPVLLGFVACVSFGVSTEALQALVPGRSPVGWDLILDAVGAAAGLYLAASRDDRRQRVGARS